jgi:TM2 domain-containing membrane protein YozV
MKSRIASRQATGEDTAQNTGRNWSHAMTEAQPQAQAQSQHPTPAIAYLLWLLCFTGLCGIHRFYTGRWITGIIWLLTAGLLFIGQIIDLILIPDQCRSPGWQS